MLVVFADDPNKELIQKYEEEIDRNRIMIDKAVISSMMNKRESKLRTVDLFYIALIAKDIERLADHIIVIDEKEKQFLTDVLDVVKSLKEMIDLATDPKTKIDYHSAIKFSAKAIKLKEGKGSGIESYHKVRIRHYLANISDVLMDWAVTNEIE
jgi:phosphate uptake regulator